MLFAHIGSSQLDITNDSGEDWTVNYYGNSTTVASGGGTAILNPGTNCNAGINVTGSDCGGPTTISAPDRIEFPTCSETAYVVFSADPEWSTGPCTPSASWTINAEMTFEP